jgi:GNAT superfamily N-acetyltransferase
METTIEKAKSPALQFHPVTQQRWTDFEQLFGEKGACGGCWCMWWRLKKKDYDAHQGAGNRQAMQRIVASGRVPGILAYRQGRPVGWCSVAPREEFIRLANSRILKPVDQQPVWSIVCLFVEKAHRRSGVSTGLLSAAVDYVREQRGQIVEGYAVEPKQGKLPDAFAYQGLAAAYRKAGFHEVLRRSATRPIMRFLIA